MDATKTDLAAKLTAIVGKQIQADPAHLIETIRRQFPDPDEYARELVANGCDAGATRIVITGEFIDSPEQPAVRIRFEDDGCGMDFDEIEHYLTLFESFKDEKRQTVGRHGVGKLSPWACADLVLYEVDTRKGNGRTVLEMTAADTGKLSQYRYKGPSGTAISLLFRTGKTGEAAVSHYLGKVKWAVNKFCTYLPVQVILHDLAAKTRGNLTKNPCDDGWLLFRVNAGARTDCKCTVYWRYGRGNGVLLYQGGVFLKSISSITHDSQEKRIPKDVELMVDAQSFEVPISRNEVVHNRFYYSVCALMYRVVLPGIIGNLCDRLCDSMMYPLDEEVRFRETIADYLVMEPHFPPAQHIPLIPVLPFKRVSIAEFAEEYARTKRTIICSCRVTKPEEATTQNLVVDKSQTGSSLKEFLEKHFSPVVERVYEDDVIEMPAGSDAFTPLTDNERKLQESLTLLSAGVLRSMSGGDGDRDGSAPDPQSMARAILGALSGSDGGGGGDTDASDISDVSFRLARLVKMDGKTPAEGTRYLCRDKLVLVNIYNSAIQAVVEIAANASPELAGHILLRELLLIDTVTPLRHLCAARLESLLYSDACARCCDIDMPRQGGGGRHRKSAGYNEDLRRYLGG